ncbi:MAG: 30S ribosomal protein S6, partial [Actinomycetota bacterium]
GRMGLPLLLPQGAVRPEEVDLREYEMMLIAPAEADDKVIGGITDRISQLLGSSGGRITNVDRWGRRRFAFPIDKVTEGSYLVIAFEGDPARLKELERVLSLADEVIRFKIVVRPERAKVSGQAADAAETVSEAGPAAEAADTADTAGAGGGVATDASPATEEAAGREEAAEVSNTGAR